MAEAKEQKVVELPDFLTVRELSELMGASPIDIIKELMRSGIMASINQQIDFETAAIVASEMGYETIQAAEEEDTEEQIALPAWRKLYEGEDPSKLIRRPPVVTILGHVDHGKTSLLDKIRSANVQEGEAGGITQHIGAYRVTHEGQQITFLDTPGHEAFTAMRARGAQGADIAILVVAADDGVMPQTREAIAHAKAARVPIVVAMNKMDRSNANPDLVKQQLAEQELIPDEWDGDTLVVPVSALTGDGIDNLLEAVLLVSEDTTIQGNPKSSAAGTVIEAELDRSRGIMTTLLVQNGTLHRGDIIVVGTMYGRIKAMFNEFGEEVKEAGPSTPISIMGLSDIAEPGTLFEVIDKEKAARKLVEGRQSEASEPATERRALTLEDLYARFEAGEAKELNLIVKVDVQGSLEPIVNGLNDIALEDEKGDITVNVIHTDVGNVTESDVMLASASEAIVVGFSVSIDNAAQRRADNEHVEVRLYNVIYKLFEDVEDALTGMLEPVYADKLIGVAEVRQVFRIPRIGNVAGSYVLDGEARREADARIIRKGKEIHRGRVSALKRFQEDVKEVRTGYECGINVHGFDKFEEGDQIEFVISERVR